MTYCAAFVGNDYVVLTTDTIETIPPGKGIRKTTFYGVPCDRDGYSISDTAQKIFELSGDRLVACAGQKSDCILAIRFLNEHAAKYRSTLDLFQALDRSIDFRLGSVTLWCAEYISGKPELFAWISGRGLEDPRKGSKKTASFVMGNARFSHDYITKNAGEFLSKNRSDQLLDDIAALNAYHHVVDLHAQTSPVGFGATFVSACIGKDGVTWSPDTTYIYYFQSELDNRNRKLDFANIVGVYCRGGGIYIESRTPKLDRLALSGLMGRSDVELFWSKKFSEIEPIAKNLRSEYKTFVACDYPVATVTRSNVENTAFSFSADGKSAAIYFQPEFYSALLEKPELAMLQGAARIRLFY